MSKTQKRCVFFGLEEVLSYPNIKFHYLWPFHQDWVTIIQCNVWTDFAEGCCDNRLITFGWINTMWPTCTNPPISLALQSSDCQQAEVFTNICLSWILIFFQWQLSKILRVMDIKAKVIENVFLADVDRPITLVVDRTCHLSVSPSPSNNNRFGLSWTFFQSKGHYYFTTNGPNPIQKQ